MVTKTQLLSYIDGFKGSEISKQDVLNFIANGNVTRLELNDCKIIVNGDDELEFMYFSSGGKDKLNQLTLGQKVIATFESPDETDIAPFVNYFIGKGYRISTSVNSNEIVFVK